MKDIIERNTPYNVFTPNTMIDKNKDMYINRPQLEQTILEKVKTNMNLIIQGESGSGKTWVTRKVLSDNGYYHRFVDLTVVASYGSLFSYFKDQLVHYKWRLVPSYLEYKNNLLKSEVAMYPLTKCDEQMESCYYHTEYLKFMKNKSRLKYRHANEDINKSNFIILEHFDSISSNEKILTELTYFISLINEQNHTNTHFIILSTNSNTLGCFDKIRNRSVITTNLSKPVCTQAFSYKETSSLILKGFDKLNITFPKTRVKNEFLYTIGSQTYHLPNKIHELCSIIIKKSLLNNKVATMNILLESIDEWHADCKNSTLESDCVSM